MFNRLNGRFKHREFFMKKIKFLGIAVIITIIVLSMTSCNLEELLKWGGTLTIKNNTGGTIMAYAVSFEDVLNGSISLENINLLEIGEEIAKGSSYTKNFILDGKVYWYWAGLVSNNQLSPNLKNGEVELKGGRGQTITAE